MSIQQYCTISFTLVGDGSSTTFTYSLNKIPQISLSGGTFILNSTTLPTGASINPLSSDVPGTASIDGFGNLTITLNSAPANGVKVNIEVDLLYNSGTLAGTTAAWTSATALNTTWTLPLNG